ncbi:MAG: glycosyltransferase [Candidatus Syntrophonatronum acetioxidans]|uniref:Glycosyltransferase n=1 Tax=Candidatus Syntrophonatronum acetioxidans TaxID=1795816 RepID=A0A424YCE6_9FIRM|nr:MAG: glycosyltransferase [Candidatus Syntrophonatronum acetioxidans]
MLFAVVPAQNEENRIEIIINQLLNLPLGRVIIVLNGSSDRTFHKVKKIKSHRLELLIFRESLGIDIPRAVGAKYAFSRGAQGVLFVDGDLVGNISGKLKELLDNSLKKGLDLALTNCYPQRGTQSFMTRTINHYRQLLNEEAGIFNKIGISVPSHGPHLVSRRLLNTIPFKELAIPPVELALASREGLNIGIGAEIPHSLLGSRIKDHQHNRAIVHTIVGDCLEAISLLQKKPRSRFCYGIEYRGYHHQRRFDLLAGFRPSPRQGKNKKASPF